MTKLSKTEYSNISFGNRVYSTVLKSKPVFDIMFREFVKNLPPLNLETGPWIVGGSARKLWFDIPWGYPCGDVDVFFSGDAQRLEWVKQFEKMNVTKKKLSLNSSNDLSLLEILSDSMPYLEAKMRQSARKVEETPNAETWHFDLENSSEKLQFIKCRYGNTFLDIWKNFDFSACLFATDGKEIVSTNFAVEDCASKTLRILNGKNADSLPIRVMKYMAHGFSVSDNNIILEIADSLIEGKVQWDDY